jgi:hypothetical protein
MPADAILGATTDDRFVAFKAVADVLRHDPRLRGVVKHWAVWEGLPTDDDPAATGKLPWVRVTPVMLPCEPLCSLGGGRGLTFAPMDIHVEVAVEGSSIADAMKLWRLAELAFTPSHGLALAAVQARLEAAGINRLDCIRPGFAVSKSGGPFQGDVAGVFRLEQTLAS